MAEKSQNSRALWDVLAMHGGVPRDDQRATRDQRGDLPLWKVPVPIECDGDRYTLIVRAARIALPDGSRVSVYPSKREWAIMIVLRELADAQSEHLGEPYAPAPFAAIFTYGRLCAVLSERGHLCAPSEIQESLEVLQYSGLEVRSADGKRTGGGRIIPALVAEYPDTDDQEPIWCLAGFGRQELLVRPGGWKPLR